MPTSTTHGRAARTKSSSAFGPSDGTRATSAGLGEGGRSCHDRDPRRLKFSLRRGGERVELPSPPLRLELLGVIPGRGLPERRLPARGTRAVPDQELDGDGYREPERWIPEQRSLALEDHPRRAVRAGLELRVGEPVRCRVLVLVLVARRSGYLAEDLPARLPRTRAAGGNLGLHERLKVAGRVVDASTQGRHPIHRIPELPDRRRVGRRRLPLPLEELLRAVGVVDDRDRRLAGRSEMTAARRRRPACCPRRRRGGGRASGRRCRGGGGGGGRGSLSRSWSDLWQ